MVALHFAIFAYALKGMFSEPTPALLGLSLIGFAPLLQWAIKWDMLRVAHHKVRLPKTSTLVLVGLGVVLLSVERDSAIIGLAFLSVGTFLLDTYWLKDITSIPDSH